MDSLSILNIIIWAFVGITVISGMVWFLSLKPCPYCGGRDIYEMDGESHCLSCGKSF